MHEQRGGGMPKWEFRRFIRRTAVRLHGGARRSGCAPLVEISAVLPQPSLADEGGVSFRIPGFFGSLAATPLQPGPSFTTIDYHSSVKAGGDVAFARQVPFGNITANFTGNLNAPI
jgi:hypothetical protein